MKKTRIFKVEMPDNEIAIEDLRVSAVMLGGKITEEKADLPNSKIDDEKKNWIIGIGGSVGDTVTTYRVYGNKQQVKKHLLELIKEAKMDDIDSWDYGTEKLCDIEENHFGDALYGYGVWTDYHLDYVANPEEEPEVL